MRIKIISTGGTIDKVYFDAKSEFEVGSPQAGVLLGEANVSFEYEVVSLLRKDSLELTDADRQRIRERVLASPSEQILITHGTDTMRQTALALAGIPVTSKEIVAQADGADKQDWLSCSSRV